MTGDTIRVNNRGNITIERNRRHGLVSVPHGQQVAIRLGLGDRQTLIFGDRMHGVRQVLFSCGALFTWTF